MRHLLILLSVFTGTVFAQGTNTCQFPFNFNQQTGFTSQPSPTAFDNRLRGCNSFTLDYQVIGLSVVSVTLQSAGGPNTGGSFGTYSGTVTSGANPSTSIAAAGGEAVFAGYVGWLRVLVTGTPTGTAWSITGTVYGSQTGYAPSTSIKSCTSAAAASCFVQGAAAAGGAVAGFPVLIAGKDGAGNAQDVATGTDGGVSPASVSAATADGKSQTQLFPASAAGTQVYNSILPYKFNGATWDQDFTCPNSATISFSAASGSLQLVGLVSGKIIRICHISFAASVASNFTFQYGTGSNCGTGTTSLSGAYNNISYFAFDFGGTLRTPASQEFCLNSSVAITGGGTVTYAQF